MERLFYNLKKFKNKIALISQNEKKYTYEEVEKESKILSSKVDSNSTIVIIGSNTIECILGYIAFMKSDNLIILLDENFKIDYIKKIIKKYQPNYVFSPNKTLIKLKKYNTIFSGKDFSLIKTRYKTLKKKNKINYLLLSTSGTSQSPKFVRLSRKNIINNTNEGRVVHNKNNLTEEADTISFGTKNSIISFSDLIFISTAFLNLDVLNQ